MSHASPHVCPDVCCFWTEMLGLASFFFSQEASATYTTLGVVV